jgi:predicted transcriptional regulator YdeE
MTIKTIDRPVLTVVGLAIRTMPQSPDIRKLWPKFVARIDEIANPAEPRVSYGVMRHERGALHYMAAISVSSAQAIPAGMESSVIPAGTYATFRYPLAELGKGFGEIFNELLPASGFEPISGQTLYERYDEKFDPDNPRSMVEIGIPVRRK